MVNSQNHSDIDVKDIFCRLKRFFENDNNVVFAMIFGSYAVGRQKKGSDVDVAVYFINPPQGMSLLNFINKLCEHVEKEVDLIVLNHASAFVRHQVMKNRLTVVIRDHLAYRRFREKTMTDYDEYKFISGMNLYD